MNPAQNVGITPAFLQLAGTYVAKGLGRYDVAGEAWYDEVVVRQQMPWHAEEKLMGSGFVIVAEFMSHGSVRRSVDFHVIVDGFSGFPALRLG